MLAAEATGRDLQFFNGLLTAELSQGAYRGIGIPLYSSAAFAMIPEVAALHYRAYTDGDEATRMTLLREFYTPARAAARRDPRLRRLAHQGGPAAARTRRRLGAAAARRPHARAGGAPRRHPRRGARARRARSTRRRRGDRDHPPHRDARHPRAAVAALGPDVRDLSLVEVVVEDSAGDRGTDSRGPRRSARRPCRPTSITTSPRSPWAATPTPRRSGSRCGGTCTRAAGAASPPSRWPGSTSRSGISPPAARARHHRPPRSPARDRGGLRQRRQPALPARRARRAGRTLGRRGLRRGEGQGRQPRPRRRRRAHRRRARGDRPRTAGS